MPRKAARLCLGWGISIAVLAGVRSGARCTPEGFALLEQVRLAQWASPQAGFGRLVPFY